MNVRLEWGPEPVRAISHSEEPDLADRFDQLFPSVWPVYNRHGDILAPLWPRLYEDFPDLQFVLVGEDSGDLLARANTIPLAWDGTPDGLPEGIDGAIGRGIDNLESRCAPDALSAMAAEVPPAHRSRRLGTLLLRAMAQVGRTRGLPVLLAPVRPNHKERYPLTPIERYMHFRRPDGTPLDPWLRTHTAMGARLLKPEPRSLRVTATVAEWERWTGLLLPESGSYVIPHGLAPLEVDVEADRGTYFEPNIWVAHDLAR